MKKRFTSIALVLFLAFGSLAQQRIVGGQNATDYADYPWMVGLSDGSDPAYQLCGASLITSDWVLTAAHCFYDNNGNYKPPASLHAFLGVYQLSNPGSHESIEVDQIIIHPNYNTTTQDNDIALLHLKTSSAKATIALPEQGEVDLIQAGAVHKVIGWGDLSDGANQGSDYLQKLDAPIIATGTCNAGNAYNGVITSNMLCAGYMSGGKDACQGDSGGPLFIKENNQYVQSGIVSWGYGCAQANLPGVYTKVANYITWIDSKIGVTTHVVEYPDWLNLKWDASYSALTVQIPNGTAVEHIDVYALSGQRMDISSSESNVVNLQTLAAGLYVVKVQTKDGRIATQKIIKP